jgi:hypothetical protein
MKWVKASERLPKQVFDPTLMVRYIHSKRYVYDFGDFVKYQPQNLDAVEWLDESPSCKVDELRNQEELWNEFMQEWYDASTSDAKPNVIEYLKTVFELKKK